MSASQLEKTDITFIVTHNMRDISQIVPFLIPQDKLNEFAHDLSQLIQKYARLKEAVTA